MFCTTCDEETEHEVLSRTTNQVIKCTICGTVSRIPVPKEPALLQIKAIVSNEGASSVCKCEIAEDEEVAVGDYLIAESDDGEGTGIEVMSIESGDKRLTKSLGKDIDTLWTRVIDQVVVRFSVHDGWHTLPLYVRCEGDEKFVVGDVYVIKGVKSRIGHIRMRNGAVTKRRGKFEVANTIKRIYAYRI
ncbi:MAG TPA: HVO_0476 family zinc finger protein [Methanospirillum sp.]|uniref:HVO_0476 family zinc finger protein n=1 Tax=Methanospirillum sp. TaxID=45200 RepID=UPI002C76779A|nr:HVO_0476 family zinc finger protein [Methanospirillum sp.]HWQ63705.1 HVO_0476 family zinc finger protein [Methanospirillum sp.]